ncbi:MAG: hypothetical protein R2712_31195 [Vicinamibacterales bacterium]
MALRPHRPGGFVLKADTLDDKTLIHNYGHGGAGMSLSWGTASMAADMAADHQTGAPPSSVAASWGSRRPASSSAGGSTSRSTPRPWRRT